MGKTTTRLSRPTRVAQTPVTATSPCCLAKEETIVQLRDEVDELSEQNDNLQHKVIQLEERTQYLEANARLDASMLAKENMDLKEKTRKLNISLSTAVDERDALALEKRTVDNQIAEMEDEAIQLSTQLKDAWLRNSSFKTSQEELVQKLMHAEAKVTKLDADLAKATDTVNTSKHSLGDDKKQWEAEKREYLAEINSFKEKLINASKDGGQHIMDWVQDKARLRESLKHERNAWNAEKKGFLDQIASLKIKASSLSIQPKAPPPEWTLEKHRLTEQCNDLRSKLASLEGDRPLGRGSVKKLETEKAKLDKKVELLKAKLAEVMEHVKTMQANVEAERAKAKRSPGRPRAAPTRARRRNLQDTDDEEDDDEEEDTPMEPVAEAAPERLVKPAPARRMTRAKRTAAVKQVNYQVDSDTSMDSDEDSESAENDGGDESADNVEGDEAMPSVDRDETNEADAQGNKEGKAKSDAPALETFTLDDDGMAEEESRTSPSPSGPRRTSQGRARSRRISDDEFEPPKKPSVVKKIAANSLPVSVMPKGRTATSSTPKKATPVVMIPPRTPLAKKGVTEVEAVSIPTETSFATPLATVEVSSGTSTPVNTTEGESSLAPQTVNKVKKKRKLLTGKGLEELGDILNGPGASMSPTSSSSLLTFKAAKKKTTPSLLNTQPKTTKSLNVIKMGFALPKPRSDP